MSDRSHYSSSEEGAYRDSDDQLDYENDDDEGSDEEEEDASEGDDDGQQAKVVDVTNLQLCPQHKPGAMSRSCSTCAAALNFINDKGKVKMLTQNGANTEDDFVNKYGTRCDDVTPTLLLSDSTVKVATQVFNKGQFRDKRVWGDIVKKFLTVSPEVHEALSVDLKSEDSIEKLRRDKRYSHVFQYRQDLSSSLKSLRVTQRLIFSLAEKINVNLSVVRGIGEKAGIKYPDKAPPREGGSVPRDGRSIPDQLHYSSAADVFSRPDLSQFCRDNELSEEAAKTLADMFEDYRDSFSNMFMELYDVTSKNLTESDDNLILYFDLYSHVDAGIRDLLRDKLASLFKNDVKSDLLTQSSSKKLTEKATGLFGG